MTEATRGGHATEQAPAWRRVVPFVVAGALVAVVLARIDYGAFYRALASTNYVAFLAFTVAFTFALLASDTLATTYVYRRTVCPIRYRELFVIRAASYLASIVNHHVGQAWLTYFIARVYRAPIWRVAGATLLVYASVLATLVLFGVAAIPPNQDRMPWLGPIVGILALAGLGYLAVVRAKPGFLARRQTVAPLMEAGVSGHVAAVALRVPHLCVLFAGTWIPFWFFGVRIPFGDALALVPPLMLVVGLPITPQGVGTRDLLAIQLFAGYATGSVEQREAAVAAATLSWACSLTLVQVGIAPLFLRKAYRLLGKRSAGHAAREGGPESESSS